jgi:hypothetical protein
VPVARRVADHECRRGTCGGDRDGSADILHIRFRDYPRMTSVELRRDPSFAINKTRARPMFR